MNLTRHRAIALLAAAVVLPRCSPSGSLKIGSKNFTESILIAEIYARALERAGIAVERRLNLGSTQIALAAMQRGDIDLYPEYTGTALIDVLHLPPVRDSHAMYETVKHAFAQRFALTWLSPSPMNDSQGIATTRALAARYGMRTLSDLSRLAPHLRLATIPEFTTRPDGLPGLAQRYGGFHFASIRTYDIALKYEALRTGAADVTTAFTTDGTISTERLVLLEDDKHFWPAYNVAPVIRSATLAAHPRIAHILNAISPAITSDVVQRMNAQIESDDQDPADVAAAFVAGAAA